MAVLLANNVVSTLAADLTIGATSLNVAVGTGAKFPGPIAPDYFYATLISPTGEIEVVKVTARVNDVLTITRAQDSTTAKAFPSGSRIEVRVNAKSVLDAVDDGVADSVATMTVVTNALDARIDALEAFDATLGGSTGAAAVDFIQSGTGAVTRTLQSKLRDVICVLDFMSDAKRDDVIARTGLYDHSTEIVAACNAGIAQGKAVYMPGGQYNYGATGQLRAVQLLFNLSSNQTLHIFGDGPGNTVIKEAAGQNAVIGRFDTIFSIRVPIGVTANAIILRDFTVDKNGASNGPEPSSYAWEQSHCISITGLYSSAAASGAFKNVLVENVDTVDKVGGGIVLAGGAILSATLRNCHGRDFSGLFGTRGDIEFQATVQNMIVDGCTGDYVQSEPNVTTPFLALKPVVATFIACRYKIYDLLGYTGDQDVQTFNLINCETVDDGEVWVRVGSLNISGGRLGAPSVFDWRIASSKISDCTIVINVDVATNAFKPFYMSNVLNVAPYRQDHIFTNCKFVAASTANASTTGYAFISSACPTTSVYNCQFVNCEFSSAFQYTAECYRGGTLVFRNCKLASRAGAWAIRAGSDNTYISDVTIDNCDLTNIAGELFTIAAAGTTNWRLRFVGVMDYAKFLFSGRPPTEYQDTKVVHNCIWMSDSRPAVDGLNGQIVRIHKPALGTAHEFVCTAGSLTAATWRMSQQAGIGRGTTANRPVPNANDIGLQYMDTTLDADGKPIWWTGTAWVDATGLAV